MSSFQAFHSAKLLNSIAALLLLAVSPTLHAAGEIIDTAVAGGTVTLLATADGSPAPAFQWTKNGTNIPGATGGTLVLHNVSSVDSAVYNVVANNPSGWALSNDFVLTVTAPQSFAAPSFTVQPYAVAEAPAGTSLTLGATAVGTPAPKYQWYKNGVAIPGASSATLTFNSLTLLDTGSYTVTATNIAGSATSNVSALKVVPPAPLNVAPVITTQPVNQAAFQKGTATFTVAASGVPAPTFQWYKNGVAIPGATKATYTISFATFNNVGTYFVQATNVAGTVMSSQASFSILR